MVKKTLIQCAQDPHILRSSFMTALVVGTVLAFINHAGSILAWSLSPFEIIQILITYCVPFLVATYAAAKNAKRMGDKADL